MAPRKAAQQKDPAQKPIQQNPSVVKPVASKNPVVQTQTPMPTQPPVQTTPSKWVDYLRFGESYTSLILGIIVVIITTILLVFTVKDRSVLPLNSSGNITKDISSTKIEPTISVETTIGEIIATGTPIPTVPVTVTTSATPTKIAATPTGVATVVPTKTVPTTKPTNNPTQAPTMNPTAVMSNNSDLKPTVVSQGQATQNSNGQKMYTVSSGDSLWSIAEKFYQSGYNWVDIASANKLSNPGVISAGTKLIIPNVTPKLATVQNNSTTEFGPKITGSTYTVQKGDHLWGIAVRAYGDGYKWTEIAKLNNITSPSVIYTGMVLKLPRTNAPPAR